MKTLVVYDSLYGNTAKIAKVACGVIGNSCKVLPVGSAKPSDLTGSELLIIGSPTHGGRPTPAIQKFIDLIDPADLRRMRLAVFDTRMGAGYIKVFGFAADRMAEDIKRNRGCLAAPPEGFVVLGKEGPLKDGEIDRAMNWTKKLLGVPIASA